MDSDEAQIRLTGLFDYVFSVRHTLPPEKNVTVKPFVCLLSDRDIVLMRLIFERFTPSPILYTLQYFEFLIFAHYLFNLFICSW